MDWFLSALEFLEENFQAVKENFFLFVVWTVLCIGLTLAISTWKNKRLKDTINSLKETNAELRSENEALLNKYSALDEKYSSMDEKTRLLLGVDNFPCTTAKTMSQNIMKGKQSKKKRS